MTVILVGHRVSELPCVVGFYIYMFISTLGSYSVLGLLRLIGAAGLQDPSHSLRIAFAQTIGGVG